MPTQRFEGTTLDEAVQTAVRQAGPSAKIISANRVRKGGIGGFFAHEHVEVEVEVAPAPSGPVRASAKEPSRPVAHTAARAAATPHHAPATPQGAPAAPQRSEDPLTSLIEEMATSGPSSVLDLAEQVNTEEKHFSLARPRQEAPRPSVPVPASPTVTLSDLATQRSDFAAQRSDFAAPSSDFATVLARIAKESGLAPDLAGDILVDDGTPAESMPVHHSGAILSELEPVWPGELVQTSLTTEARLPSEAHLPAEPQLPTDFRLPVEAQLPTDGQVPSFGLALHQLGLPLPACQEVRPAATRQSLERELARTLRACLPSLPATPRSASSVVAVVGPKNYVMAAARELAREMGTNVDDVALATRRKVWRQQDHVITSAEIAAEQRRSWRWRGKPSVVAIEHDVRPDQASWATQVLKALGPTLCWGVAPATHKAEDLEAWSGSLGGLDVIALVDLASTTTPAAALATAVPVGRLDGAPATPETWAKVLCDRLLG